MQCLQTCNTDWKQFLVTDEGLRPNVVVIFYNLACFVRSCLSLISLSTFYMYRWPIETSMYKYIYLFMEHQPEVLKLLYGTGCSFFGGESQKHTPQETDIHISVSWGILSWIHSVHQQVQIRPLNTSQPPERPHCQWLRAADNHCLEILNERLH